MTIRLLYLFLERKTDMNILIIGNDDKYDRLLKVYLEKKGYEVELEKIEEGIEKIYNWYTEYKN